MQQPQPKPKVFVTRLLPEDIRNELLAHVDAEFWESESPAPYAAVLEKVRGKAGLVCLVSDRIDAPLMDAAPGLKVISQTAVGYDNIDVPAATARGIKVGNTPGVVTDDTADFTFALLLAAARRLGEGIDYIRQGNWNYFGLTYLLGQPIQGATLGIIGMGRIGRAVAKRARGFDMRILYSDQNRLPDVERDLGAEYRSMDDLLREADFVTLHVNLSPATRRLIGKREFDLMKPTATFVNAARGPIVDPAALYDALHDHKIASAAIDVTDPEPIPLNDRLLTLPNLIVAPHIATATVPTRMRMMRMAIENLVTGLNGHPLPYPVN